jgi:hypothetical protein
MTEEQYKVEWLLKDAGDLSEDEKRELIEELANELDAEDEVEYGGQFKRQSISAFDVSVGILLVSSLNTVINIYKTLQERDDSNIGIRQVNNEMFYIDEVDADTIEKHNGDIITNVEGDVYFFTLPDDMEDHIELMQELRENEEEDE